MADHNFRPDDPVPLLKDMMRCASVTPETAGVLDVVEAALAGRGFTVTRLTFSGDGSYPVENLFATRGTVGRHLLFAGHTDVVPPGDVEAWSHPPFAAEEAEGHIWGRGAADMKSGVAAFIAALDVEPQDHGIISLAITNDEEADAVNGTEKLMAWAQAQGHRFDFAVVGEPSSSAVVGDSIKIGRRGSFSGQITVTGTQGHVAYPDKANNPLPVLAAAVSVLSRARLDTGTAHFPPSNLEFTSIDVGNPVSNVIPAQGTARFNIRFNDLWTPESLTEWVLGRLGSVDTHGVDIAFEVSGRGSQSFLSPLGPDLDVLCDIIEAGNGARPQLSTGGGTSDARFIAQYCPVIECGLVGTTMHKVDERVTIDDVRRLSSLYRAFIRDFFAEADAA